jgi:hypothetical protein
LHGVEIVDPAGQLGQPEVEDLHPSDQSAPVWVVSCDSELE